MQKIGRMSEKTGFPTLKNRLSDLKKTGFPT
jgi:hypothetical protein